MSDPAVSLTPYTPPTPLQAELRRLEALEGELTTYLYQVKRIKDRDPEAFAPRYPHKSLVVLESAERILALSATESEDLRAWAQELCVRAERLHRALTRTDRTPAPSLDAAAPPPAPPE